MNIKTQERAFKGVFTLFEDLMFLEGKGFIARGLRPHLKGSFTEPGSILHRQFDAYPAYVADLIHYMDYQPGQRRRAIIQFGTRKQWRDVIPLIKDGFLFLADLYQRKKISAAEAERQIEQEFEDALNNITLDELVKTHDNVSKNEFRTCLVD